MPIRKGTSTPKATAKATPKAKAEPVIRIVKRGKPVMAVDFEEETEVTETPKRHRKGSNESSATFIFGKETPNMARYDAPKGKDGKYLPGITGSLYFPQDFFGDEYPDTVHITVEF